MNARALILAGLASLAPAAARASAPAAAKSTETASFVAAAPAGWSATRDGDALRLSGPRDADGVGALIVARYYAPGDKTFPDADAYVKRQTAATRFDPPGAKPAVVSTARAGGRDARRIVRDGAETARPGSMNSHEVPTREELVVVSGAAGFYVLSYDAPVALFAKNRGAFLSVLNAFKPKK